MNQLHAFFTLRNQKAFRQLLDRGPPSASGYGQSTSGPKSWTWQNGISSSAAPVDVNAKDYLGRTVLHLACASNDNSTLDYVRMLLAHPAINVNSQDSESRWTPLHRALYAGNLCAAILLLQRVDIDVTVKDYEGYTAFDLYNSTVEGTRPNDADSGYKDLFAWGVNRNAALGLGDGDDRAFPEQVVISPLQDREAETSSIAKLRPIQAKGVAMSKLHTVVITAEKKSNVRLCGFGSGGRLGPGQHTQYSLVPLQQFDQTIVSVALGQDHSLALTESGTVFSWGLNRFSQLGYVVDVPTTTLGRSEEPMQPIAKRIYGPLKKEVVRGVAACKTASACWTTEDVFTWGTNNGQLGYAEHVQVLPRKVAAATDVMSVTITDLAMACLLITEDVLCFMNNRHFKISFPIQRFRGDFVYPPQGKPNIAKVVSCENSFAALSLLGDVYHWTLQDSTSGESSGGSKEREKERSSGVKPQLIWERRKQFSAVTDVSLGSDGGMIICTQSGHVFVRSRNLKAGSDARRQSSGVAQSQTSMNKAYKFHRVPYLQRVVQVCTNSTGAFAALRSDAKPEAIQILGNSLPDDLADVQPYMTRMSREDIPIDDPVIPEEDNDAAVDVDGDDGAIQNDIKNFLRLCSFLSREKDLTTTAALIEPLPSHGADLTLVAGVGIPAHRVIVAARCPTLLAAMQGVTITDGRVTIKLKKSSQSTSGTRLIVTGCHSMTVLLLLQYLYTDDVSAFWDRRIGMAVEPRCSSLGIHQGRIKTELQVLARVLRLQPLSDTLTMAVKRPLTATLSKDFGSLFFNSHTEFSSSVVRGSSPLSCDVALELADRNVGCHSIVLRARSSFFACFFDDEDWTSRRWQSGVLKVNMMHLSWKPMSFVLAFMYGGKGAEMFDDIDLAKSSDELIDFVFLVMAAANELLLDKLVLICSSVILRHVTVANVCSVLADATYFHSIQLVQSLHGYMAANMEWLLEGRLLDDVLPDLMQTLSEFIRRQQAKKFPVSKSNLLVDKALTDHAEWLALQDIPQPIARFTKPTLVKSSPKLSPVPTSNRTPRRSPSVLPTVSPVISPLVKAREQPQSDGLFAMDEDAIESIPVLNLNSPLLQAPPVKLSTHSKPSPSPWKAAVYDTTNKVDLKSIMEAESSKSKPAPPRSRVAGFNVSDAEKPSNSPQWRSKPMERKVSQSSIEAAAGRAPTSSSSTPWAIPPSGTSRPSPSRIGSASNVGQASTSTPISYTNGVPVPGTRTPTKRAPLMVTPPQLKPTPPTVALGPVITPVRAIAVDTSTKKRTVLDAWTTPPAVQDQDHASPSSSSFASIQQQQRDQASGGKSKKSLLQIQQEEQQLQAEVDFMKWWTAEEERLKAGQTPTGGESAKVKRGRPGKSARGTRGPTSARPNADTVEMETGTSRIQKG